MKKFLKILFILPLATNVTSFAVMWIFAMIAYYISEGFGVSLGIIVGGAWGIFFGSTLAYKIVDDLFGMVAGFFSIILIVGGIYFYLDYYQKDEGKLKANIHLRETHDFKKFKYFQFLDAQILSQPIGFAVKKFQQKDNPPSYVGYYVAPMVGKEDAPSAPTVWFCQSYSGRVYNPQPFLKELNKSYPYFVQTGEYAKPFRRAIQQATGQKVKAKDVILLEGIASPKAAKEEALRTYLFFLLAVNCFWVLAVLGYYFYIGWKGLFAKEKNQSIRIREVKASSNYL